MQKLEITAYDLAQRFVGIKEIEGPMSNPQILAMLKLDDQWPEDDSVPWCSAFVNYICWLLRLPRSKSLRARSWLMIGYGIELHEAKPGFDVAIFRRGRGKQPGPEVITAPGHVGFFAGMTETIHDDYRVRKILLLGGNQKNSINVGSYPIEDLLGIRRLI